MLGISRPAAVGHTQVAPQQGRGLIAAAKGLQRRQLVIEPLQLVGAEVVAADLGINLDRRYEIFRAEAVGGKRHKAHPQAGHMLRPQAEPRGLRVSTEFGEQVLAGGQGLDDVETRHGAGRAPALAPGAVHDKDGAAIGLGQTPCHEAEHAGRVGVVFHDQGALGRVRPDPPPCCVQRRGGEALTLGVLVFQRVG